MLYRSPIAAKIPGVLFAEDFGEDDEEHVAVPMLDKTGTASGAASQPSPVAAAGSTDEEIETERVRAREEGFNAGLQAAHSSSLAERARTLGRLEEALKATFSEMQTLLSGGLALVAETLLFSLNECLPALCERHGADEMREFVRSILPTLEDDLHLVITVHPNLEDALEEEIEALGLKARQIKISKSERMLIGDIAVKWDDGLASRDVSRWQNDMVSQLDTFTTTHGTRGRL